MGHQGFPTYEEYKESKKKYDGSTSCFVYGCDKPGEYEGGDARFYCAVCEEHARLKECYDVDYKYDANKRRITRIRKRIYKKYY